MNYVWYSLFLKKIYPKRMVGWSTIGRQVTLTSTATIIVALAAHQAGRPDLIRAPKRVLAQVWVRG